MSCGINQVNSYKISAFPSLLRISRYVQVLFRPAPMGIYFISDGAGQNIRI